ncbi:MAG: 3-oxoacyl-ACP reductase FabG [Oceanospirillaceae bacterium]|nr:3-oxoacyl-ACP reductase FabG [Oceanospirillaceae bacterium]
MNSLKGKVALVTGGSRGMGAAIARRLAAEGADVVLTYNSSADKAYAVVAEIVKMGRKSMAIAADSSDCSAIQGAVQSTVAEFGQLDILINNAGIFVAKPIDELTLDDFEQSIAVNVRAVFVASQAAAVHMGEGARIITIGSNLAEQVPMQGLSLYSLSKSALTGFTKGLARDLGPRGITVNIVHPGPTDTDMNPANGEYADVLRGLMAIPRFGDPEDIAGFVSWLASAESRFITGTGLTIDGGTNA